MPYIALAALPLVLLISLPIWSQTVDEVAAEVCRLHPDSVLCPTDPIPPDPNEPTTPPDPPPPGDYVWRTIPWSSMDQLYSPVEDCGLFDFANWPYNSPNCDKVWEHIQEGWSGATVSGDWAYIHGGGHGGSPHNGVFRVNIAGQWERVTDASPLWTTENCPTGTCTMPNGQTCPIAKCAIMPDGQPASVHTYNSLASDGRYLYRTGGSWWYGSGTTGPQNWKMDLLTGQWSPFSDSGMNPGRGSAFYKNGRLYVSNHKWTGVYDVATDTWNKGNVDNATWSKFGDLTNVMECGGGVFAIGGDNQGGRIGYSTTLDAFPSGWVDLPDAPVLYKTGVGAACWGGAVWTWAGGASFDVFDPRVGVWSVVTPEGQGPGQPLFNGTFGRLFVLSGELCLVNGVDKDLQCVKPVDPDKPPPTNPDPPTACTMPPDEPTIVPDPRGEEWGHSILIPAAIGQSEPATVKSCAQVSGWACIEVNPDQMDGYTAAVDALPERGGVVILQPGVHVLTTNTQARRGFKLLHILGVPDDCGNRPILRSAMTYAEKDANGRYQQPDVEPKTGINFARTSQNLILENVDIQNFAGSCVRIDNGFEPDQIDQTVLVKNSLVHHCYYVGFSMGRGPLTDRRGRLYIIDSEMAHISSGAHMLYLAGGRIAYAKNSYFHSAGWHAFKVIAHNVAIVDSVLSQDGLDGERTPRVGAINEGFTAGQGAAASLVACQRGVVTGTTFIHRLGPAAARQRRYAIDGCDFGAEYGSEKFWSETFWQQVVAGGDIEDGNPELLPIYWSNNTFRYKPDGRLRYAVSNSSTYPNEKKGPLPAPDFWVERSRDAFWNNVLEGYDGLYMCGSPDDATGAVCMETMLRELQDKPDWFITDPEQVHPDLRPITVAEIYAI